MSPTYAFLLIMLLTLAGCDQNNGPELPERPAVAVTDLQRFPPAAVVGARLDAANDHIDWLKRNISAYPATYGEWLGEAERCRDAWLSLHCALCADQYEETAENMLRELRDRIGPENYFAGRMPPPVPLERFREIGR